MYKPSQIKPLNQTEFFETIGTLVKVALMALGCAQKSPDIGSLCEVAKCPFPSLPIVQNLHIQGNGRRHFPDRG